MIRRILAFLAPAPPAPPPAPLTEAELDRLAPALAPALAEALTWREGLSLPEIEQSVGRRLSPIDARLLEMRARPRPPRRRGRRR